MWKHVNVLFNDTNSALMQWKKRGLVCEKKNIQRRKHFFFGENETNRMQQNYLCRLKIRFSVFCGLGWFWIWNGEKKNFIVEMWNFYGVVIRSAKAHQWQGKKRMNKMNYPLCIYHKKKKKKVKWIGKHTGF